MRPIFKNRRMTIGSAALWMSAVIGTIQPSHAQPRPADHDTPPRSPAPQLPVADATSIREQSIRDQSIRDQMGFRSPRVTMTRDVAAQQFLELLQRMGSPNLEKPDDEAAKQLMMSSFSRSSETENLPALLCKLSQQVGSPDQTVSVQNEGEKIATVVIETKSRPLVLVQEGDSWGVDVLETFAVWNHLEGAAKTTAVAALKIEFNQQRDSARRSSCQSNLKQISLGLLQYVQDHDEQLPKAENWIDKILPYIKSERVFTCPSVLEPAKYGYAFNFNFSLKPLASFASPSESVSFYETTILERNMFGIGDEPAFRHQDGANYAFVDGHIKWFPKTQIPSFKLK